MIAAALSAMGGAALLITTPNHPGAPADPALHPAVHVALGLPALLCGVGVLCTRLPDRGGL